MVSTSSRVIRFGPLTPMNTSLPRSRPPRAPVRFSGLVCSANHCLATLRPARPVCTAPWRSAPITLGTPASMRILAMATPAAPTPAMTTVRSLIFLSTIFSEFSSAARQTTAVPCWSSWNTGMSRISFSRSSTSKHPGAAMSSRLMPPKVGAMRATVSMISSGSRGVEADREAVDAGELLEQQRLALHDRHGAERADVAEAEHRGAVADDGHGVLLDGELVGELGLGLDGLAHPGDTRRVGHRQVVAVADRHAGDHLDLAAVVHGEGAVLPAQQLDALRVAHGLDDLLLVGLAPAVHDDVLVEVLLLGLEAVERPDVAAYRADRARQSTEGAGRVVQAHSEADAEGGGGCVGHRATTVVRTPQVPQSE